MAIYHIYANNRNLGDWLSAKAIGAQLGISGVRPLLWTQGEFEKTLATVGQLDETDLLIAGGGGMLKDFFSELWTAIVNSKARLVLWGVGVCLNKDHLTALDDSLIRQIGERAELIAVRDKFSEAAFLSHGVAPIVSGCPTISYVRQCWRRRSEGVLLHAIHPELVGDRLPAWRSAVQAFASDNQLDYVEHEHSLPRARLKRWRALRDTRQLYGTASVIVSSRLHGVLFGLALEKPLIVISGDEKFEGFWCHTVGASSCATVDDNPKEVLETRGLPANNGERVVKNVAALIDKNSEVCQKVRSLASAYI